MQIVAVDHNPILLAALAQSIRSAAPDAQLSAFETTAEAIAFAEASRVDILFLEPALPNTSGIALAEKVRQLHPRVNLIFTAGSTESMPDAFRLNASGYLLKPVTVPQIQEQLEVLRFPVKVQVKLRLQCFGNFEAFIHDRPLRFRHGKTKELLAYLAFRRGATCTNNEIMAAIWEDDTHGSYLRDLRKDLVNTLSQNNCEDAIELGRGKMALIMERVNCDYYQWLDGTASGANAYHGEFMSQYSWAEFVNAAMQERL